MVYGIVLEHVYNGMEYVYVYVYDRAFNIQLFVSCLFFLMLFLNRKYVCFKFNGASKRVFPLRKATTLNLPKIIFNLLN